jgi:hypothetical protein
MYNGRYIKTWQFAETESEARTICARENATGTAYKRRKHPAYYTPWSSTDGHEHKYIVWYVI